MKIVTIIGISIPILLAVFAYVSTNNIIVALVVLLLSLAYYMLYAHKKLKKYIERVDRTHECYHFVNSFLITMSVKESINEAFASATINPSIGFKKELDEIDSLNVEDKIIYLRRYFNLAIYKMFINVLNLYIDQGGNILYLGESLMNETTRVEESVTKSHNIGLKKLTEFAILWILTFAILIFMKFGLNDFYNTMLTNNIFIYFLCFFFLFFLAAVHVFITKFIVISVKEDKIDEED